MALLDKPVSQPGTFAPTRKGRTVIKWITSTDHKVIGNLYMITSFFYFMLAGLMALGVRAELAKQESGSN